MDALCTRIKDARIAAGLSQKQLAERLGYKSTSAIARIENGDNNFPMSKVDAFADALGVHPSYLWNGNRENYHTDAETAELVRQLHDTPELRVVMNSTKKLTPEAVKEVQKFIDYQLAKEEGKK